MLRGIGLALAVVSGAGWLALAGPTLAPAQERDALPRARDLTAEAGRLLRDARHAEGIVKAREALALRERERGSQHPGVAETLQVLGDLLRESGDLAGARPVHERALAIRERAFGAQHPLVAQTLHALGQLRAAAGEYAEARPLLERALAIREQALGPRHQAVGQSLHELGHLATVTGDYAGARPLHERALAIREQALGAQHPFVALSLASLGELHRIGGDYARARSLHERALAIREQALGLRHPAVATSLSHLATVAWLTGDWASARGLHERALAIREQALGPGHPWVAVSLNSLALVLRSAGDYAAARRLYERALAIREQALGPAHPDVATTLNDLAFLLWHTADYAAARPLYERALRIREAALGPDHPQVGAVLHNLGALLQATGDLGAAEPLFRRALAIRERALGPSHPDVATTLQQLGALRRRAGDPAGARPLLERALAIRERVLGPAHPWVANALGTLAYTTRDAGDAEAARPMFERTLQIARASNPEWRWRAALALGGLHERARRLGEALPYYREAVRTLEGLAGQFGEDAQRAQYLQADNKLGAYDALARLLLKLHEQDGSRGHDREAWAVLEARKGRVAAEALAAARPQLLDPVARQAAQDVRAEQDQVLALEQALREEEAKAPGEQRAEALQSLSTQLARTKSEYLARVQAFLARYPRYKTLFVDQQTVDPKALAKLADRLPAGTLVVQYFAAPDALYLFVVAPGGLFQVKRQAVSQADLYDLVRRYRRQLELAAARRLPWADDGSDAYRRDVAPLQALARTLAGHLLGPIEAELRANRELVLLPNDLLLYLPIHALVRAGSDGGARFLAETHAVSYLTQLELVDLLTPAPLAAGAPLLALANPDGSLPGASREVRALSRARTSVTALEGAEATKERFLALVSRFPHLHLATHGMLDPERPERSYLLMAGADDASQRLGIGEIAGLSLANGLAILSACDTAVGEQTPGAALVTLAAAFSQAGAQSVVASLWKVNDAATRDFMVAFHRGLGSTGRAAAFQQAQLAVLREPGTAHPYYWAPFVLIGAR